MGFVIPNHNRQTSIRRYYDNHNNKMSLKKVKHTTSTLDTVRSFGLSKVLKATEQFNYDNSKNEEEEESDEADDVLNYYQEESNEGIIIDTDDDEVDWRSFRAHLVSIYDQDIRHQEDNPNSWIYETGSAIETGTVLLHKIDYNFDDIMSGYGLARQYLHKSVVLILEHEDNEHETSSTKGIILNRPTDLVINERYDDEGINNEFPIWFGGFDWGIHTSRPKFFCLHSIKSAVAKSLSVQVMNGIYFTTIQSAKDLITAGYAKTTDFWFFSGMLEWEKGELLTEIEEGNWYSVNTDASIIRKGLKILTDEGAMNVEHAGIQTYDMLMDLIHEKIEDLDIITLAKAKSPRIFDDLMFEEWAKKYLRFDEPPLFLRESSENNDNIDEESSWTGRVVPGSLVRGSSIGSPFLLSDQVFHKSLILIVQDDHELSAGLILNHPTTRSFDISLVDESSLFSKTNSIKAPVRFGGCYGGPTIHDPFVENDDKPLFILHMNQSLRDAKIGQPIGNTFLDGIWSCTSDQCIFAITNQIAAPEDFMFVDGFCLWSKTLEDSGKISGGIFDEIMKGDFEVVFQDRVQGAWDSLLKQELLSQDALDRNLDLAQTAWYITDQNWTSETSRKKVTVAEQKSVSLNDEALKRWIAVYLHDF